MRMSRSSTEVQEEHTGVSKAVDNNVVDVKVGVQGVDRRGHNVLAFRAPALGQLSRSWLQWGIP